MDDYGPVLDWIDRMIEGYIYNLIDVNSISRDGGIG
jgi:hypothetical protein